MILFFTQSILLSVALGYPDDDFPANKVWSEREPIDVIFFGWGLISIRESDECDSLYTLFYPIIY